MSLFCRPLPPPFFFFSTDEYVNVDVCLQQPGKHIALDLLWIAIASILTSFSIEAGSDFDYEDEIYNSKSESSESGPTTMLSHPRPFKCRFIPRSGEKYL